MTYRVQHCPGPRNGVRLLGISLLLAAGCVAPPRPDLPPARVGADRPASVAPPPVAQTNLLPQPIHISPPARIGADTPPPVPPAPRELTDGEFRQNMIGQVLLDRKNFSCGCIDGHIGPKTRDALQAWQSAKGLPASGKFDEATMAKLGAPDIAFTEYVVTVEDRNALGYVPRTWTEKAKLPALPYETILELLAEKSHASEGALRRLNPAVDWPDPPAGTVVVLPNPNPSPVRPAARLRISLGQKTIRAYDIEGRLIAFFPCSIAKDKAKRPVGTLKVANSADQPTYLFDSNLFAEDPAAYALQRRLLIPAGPNNPVGVAWIGLDKSGYGIHGTPRPEDIGKTESHGCFRLANWNARKLLRMVAIGTPVEVEE